MKRIRSVFSILPVVLLLFANPSLGDRISYHEIKDLRAEGADFVVEHHHDWSAATEERRHTMIVTHQNPFTSENNYAYISAKRKDTGAPLFRQPSPALSWLGVTADSRYIIGLSDIKVHNPYQMVVLDRSGRLIAKHHVSSTVACLAPAEHRRLQSRYARQFQALQGRVCARDGRVYIDFDGVDIPSRLGGLWKQLSERACPSPFTPDVSESVTNWIQWFDTANPDPEVIEQDGRPVALRVTDRGKKRVTIPFTCEEPGT